MASGRHVRVAARLLRELDEVGGALVGGMAVNAHGYVRATRDVDVIVSTSLDEAGRRLAAGRIATEVFRGDPLEGDFPCLKGRLNGVPFDILPPLVPLDVGRMVELHLRELRLRIVDLETLFQLKLKAGGPKDLLDVAVLAHLHPGWHDRARALAGSDKHLLKRLNTWLDDGRVAASATEIRRQEQPDNRSTAGTDNTGVEARHSRRKR